MYYVIDKTDFGESYVFDDSDNSIELIKDTKLLDLVRRNRLEVKGVDSEAISVQIPKVKKKFILGSDITFVISEVITNETGKSYRGEIHFTSDTALDSVVSLIKSEKLEVLSESPILCTEDIMDNMYSNGEYIIPIKSFNSALESWLCLQGFVMRYAPVIRIVNNVNGDSVFLKLHNTQSIRDENEHLLKKFSNCTLWSIYQNAVRNGYVVM